MTNTIAREIPLPRKPKRNKWNQIIDYIDELTKVVERKIDIDRFLEMRTAIALDDHLTPTLKANYVTSGAGGSESGSIHGRPNSIPKTTALKETLLKEIDDVSWHCFDVEKEVVNQKDIEAIINRLIP
jgi:hypothetical protein